MGVGKGPMGLGIGGHRAQAIWMPGVENRQRNKQEGAVGSCMAPGIEIGTHEEGTKGVPPSISTSILPTSSGSLERILPLSPSALPLKKHFQQIPQSPNRGPGLWIGKRETHLELGMQTLGLRIYTGRDGAWW